MQVASNENQELIHLGGVRGKEIWKGKEKAESGECCMLGTNSSAN